MKQFTLTSFIVVALLASSCSVRTRRLAFWKKPPPVSFTKIDVVDNKLVITGKDLDYVSEVKIKLNSQQEETFKIEASSENLLVASSLKNIGIAVGSVFDLILATSHAASTFQVTLTLPDHSVSGSKLSPMNAKPGQLLRFNGSSWQPTDLPLLKTSRIRSYVNELENSDASIDSTHDNNCDGTEVYVAISDSNDQGFCIETTARVASSWAEAKTNCLSLGKRLPREFEWIITCSKRHELGINSFSNSWEWISNYHLESQPDSYHLVASMPFSGECATESLFIPLSASDSGHNLSYRCAK